MDLHECRRETLQDDVAAAAVLLCESTADLVFKHFECVAAIIMKYLLVREGVAMCVFEPLFPLSALVHRVVFVRAWVLWWIINCHCMHRQNPNTYACNVGCMRNGITALLQCDVIGQQCSSCDCVYCSRPTAM